VIFLDTSVLVPIAQASHVHHVPSVTLWRAIADKKIGISVHAMAEAYATLTAMPPPLRASPADVLKTLDKYLARITPVALTDSEYLDTIRNAASMNFVSGMIYDALHLACARKMHAKLIYTWNLKHFRAIAPDLADRITTP
jgi:predicted nucleic acid-binding protein